LIHALVDAQVVPHGLAAKLVHVADALFALAASAGGVFPDHAAIICPDAYSCYARSVSAVAALPSAAVISAFFAGTVWCALRHAEKERFGGDGINRLAFPSFRTVRHAGLRAERLAGGHDNTIAAQTVIVVIAGTSEFSGFLAAATTALSVTFIDAQ